MLVSQQRLEDIRQQLGFVAGADTFTVGEHSHSLTKARLRTKRCGMVLSAPNAKAMEDRSSERSSWVVSATHTHTPSLSTIFFDAPQLISHHRQTKYHDLIYAVDVELPQSMKQDIVSNTELLYCSLWKHPARLFVEGGNLRWSFSSKNATCRKRRQLKDFLSSGSGK